MDDHDPERNTVPVHNEPPPLPYSLHTRKKSIAFFWTIFVLDTLGQPVGLYWGLWYGTNLSHNLGMFGIGCIAEMLSEASIADALQCFPLSPLVWEVSQFLNTSIVYTTSSARTRAPDR
jgi:hypothetical protein